MKPIAKPEPAEPAELHIGARGYVLTWLALVALATLTLAVSRAGGLPVALAIAVAKALLVVLFFMHLAGGRSVHRLAFGVACGFVVLIVMGVMADVGTRKLASSYVDDRGQP